MKKSYQSFFNSAQLPAISLICLALSGCANTGLGNFLIPPTARAGTQIGDAYEHPKGPPTKPHEADLKEVSDINLRLAGAYYAAREFQTANEVVTMSLAATPNDHNVLGMAALIQAELRNHTKARDYFDRAFKIAPKDPNLNHNYGVYLCHNNDPVRALEHFKTAMQVEGYPKLANTLTSSGECLSKLGRDEEAIQHYTGALRFEPGNPIALMGLADLQYRRGALREAMELSSRYARVARATPESLWLQLRVARKMGNIQDEKGYAADLRRAFPGARQTQMLNEDRYE